MKIFLKYSKSEVNLWGFASDFFDVLKVWKYDCGGRYWCFSWQEEFASESLAEFQEETRGRGLLAFLLAKKASKPRPHWSHEKNSQTGIFF